MRWPPRPWLVVLIVVVVLAGGAAVVVAAGRSAPLHRLVVAAGSRGGVYYAYGQGLVAAARDTYPGVRAGVLATAASVENLRLVAAGDADVAFSLVDSAALAVSGGPPFPRREPLRALAWLYDNYTQLVVRADSPVRTVADLRGRTVSTGADGSGHRADRRAGAHRGGCRSGDRDAPQTPGSRPVAQATGAPSGSTG